MEHLHNISELVGLIVAIIYYPSIRGTFMKWFVPFLSLIFFGEILAKHLYYYIFDTINNAGLYYTITIIESIFYSYIFYQLTTSRVFKKVLVVFAILSTAANISGLVFFSADYNLYFIFFIISGFFFVLMSLHYIYEQFRMEDAFLTKQPGFWIALGVSVFFSGTCIVFCLHDIILNNNLNLFGYKLYNLIPRLLSVVLYLCISISIILCKQKNKTLSSQ
jgi:hypothetical protein